MTLVQNLNPLLFALVGTGLGLLALLLVLAVWLGQRRLLTRYRRLLFGPKGATLESMLLGQAATIDGLRDRLRTLEHVVEIQQQAALSHVQHVGLIRYQAFPDAGSDLSFSVAILDAHKNGVVITNLHSRQQSLIYAKPIVDGGSSYSLSDEEKSAIAKALGKTS